MVKRATSKISSLKKYILLVILCYGLVELLSFAALLGLDWIKEAEFKPYSASVLFRRIKGQVEKFLENRHTYIQHHPTLGWSIQPNGSEGIYKANAQGLRGDEDYLPTPSPGVLRIATFGNSFTHGDEVSNNETWPFFLASQLSRAEVMNFGVPAFGPDQAFLRFQERGTECITKLQRRFL